MNKESSPINGRQSWLVFDFAYDIYRQGILRFFENAWHEYGDFVQFKIRSTNIFLVTNPKDIRHILIKNREKYDKLSSYKSIRNLLLGNGLVTSTGTYWKSQRRLISPAFSPQNLKTYAPIVSSCSHDFVERWSKIAEGNEPIEIIDEMMRLSSAIILKTMFSIDMEPETVKLKDAVETMIKFSAQYQMNPTSLPLWVPIKKNREYLKARERVDTYITKIVSDRKAMNLDEWPNDLLSKLMSVKNEETGQVLSDNVLRDEMVTIFFAGHETTARTLAFLWYALSENPKAEKILHSEVDNIESKNLSAFPIKNLDYTTSSIKETLRLHPSVPIYVRDVKEEDIINDIVIPKNSTIFLLPYLTHRHKDYWDEPDLFKPERWLSQENMEKEMSAYHPFGMGKRTCVGNLFSIYEMQIVIHTLARHFSLRLKPGHQPQFEMQGTMNSKNGLPMFIKKRKSITVIEKDIAPKYKAAV